MRAATIIKEKHKTRQKGDYARTNTNGKRHQGQTGKGILEQIRTTGTEKGRSGAVVFAVVG